MQLCNTKRQMLGKNTNITNLRSVAVIFFHLKLHGKIFWLFQYQINFHKNQ